MTYSFCITNANGLMKTAMYLLSLGDDFEYMEQAARCYTDAMWYYDFANDWIKNHRGLDVDWPK